MKALKSTGQLLSEARELEYARRLTESAGVYQQLVNADPTNPQAVSRLLTLYRRLKDPKKELAVIETALTAYAQKDKTTQEKWLAAHPQAAKTSRAFLRSLGGTDVSSFGANAQVQRLLKRKDVVEKKLHGNRKSKTKVKAKSAAKKPAAKKRVAPKPVAAKRKRAEERRLAAEQKKQAAAVRREAAVAKKAEAAKARKAAADERKAQAAAKKAAQAARQAEAAAAKKAATEARRLAAIPSLFIVSIRYLAALDTIDAMLPKHAAFLDKHFATGDFLAAGHQIPRTGGIIIARGKDRASVERIIRQDPFLKNKLASVDIVEFAASKLNKKEWQRIS